MTGGLGNAFRTNRPVAFGGCRSLLGARNHPEKHAPGSGLDDRVRRYRRRGGGCRGIAGIHRAVGDPGHPVRRLCGVRTSGCKTDEGARMKEPRLAVWLGGVFYLTTRRCECLNE